MPLIIFGILALIGGTAFYLLRPQNSSSSKEIPVPATDKQKTKRAPIPFEKIFRNVAATVGQDWVDWKLLAAHASVESSFNPKAYNPEGSSGLMQIYLPLKKNKSANRHFNDGNIPEWEYLDTTKIFDPEYNITLACALIRENIREYGMPRAIAVYNSSKAVDSQQFGPFPNASYVAKVQKYFDKLKAETGE